MKSALSAITFLFFTFYGQAQNSKKDYLFKLKTAFGDMTVLLYEETPLHKANFIELGKSGRYDSTFFHRVIKDFMVQGGDVFRKPGEKTGRSGDLIPAEIVDGFFHKKGELAAARQPDNVNPEKKSSSCQFYVVQGKVYDEEELSLDQNKLNRVFGELMAAGKIDSIRQELIRLQHEQKFDEMNSFVNSCKPLLEELSGEDLSKGLRPKMLKAYSSVGGTPFLDQEYTVFGRVVEGMEVIDKIAAVETKRGDEPVDRVYMTVETIEMKKKKITKLYGYKYPNSK